MDFGGNYEEKTHSYVMCEGINDSFVHNVQE